MSYDKKLIVCSQYSDAAEFKLLKKHNIQPTTEGFILWHIGNFTPDMDKFRVILAFTRAFDCWQAILDRVPPVGRTLQFRSTENFDEAHIRILFLNPGERQQRIQRVDGTVMEFEHRWPFDGNGGIVAHVPLNCTDIYFDEGEHWGDMFRWEGDQFFAPLLETAIHEIGHCLDLDHTAAPEDAMYPRADGQVRTLTDDSLRGVISAGWGAKKKAFAKPSPLEVAVTGTPILEALKFYGLKEVAGPGNQKEIIAMIKAMFPNAVNDGDVPWCSIFMNFIMSQCGLPGTGSGMARSWLKWGKPVKWEDRRLGDVVVFWRGTPSGPSGHVALYINDKDLEGNYLRVLGGNQGDTVSIANYAKNRVLELRRYE